MQIHEVGAKVNESIIDQLKAQSAKKPTPRQFEDPIREFHHASSISPMVFGWLTFPIEKRKQMVKETFEWIPRSQNESEKDFENRKLERWRGLCVVIQEESRALAGNRSPETAIAALKLLFPEHSWPKPLEK